METRNYFFTPSSYDQSLPQVNTTRTAIENALRSQPLTGNEVIIDAWCRTGQMARTMRVPLLKGNGKIVAYDDEDEMIAYANQQISQPTNIEYKTRDLTCQVLSPEVQADVLVSSWHMPFIPEEKQKIYLTNLFNHLKPDGRLILLFPAIGSKLSEVIHAVTTTDAWQPHFASLNIKRETIAAEKLSTLLEEAGFTPSDIMVRAVKHVFQHPRELKHFITTALSRYLSHLAEKTLRDKLVDDVTEKYLREVEHQANRIPYQVNMLTVNTRRPELADKPGLRY